MTTARAHAPARDAGSLAMALLLTLVGVTLSALLVPVVLAQVSATRTGAQRADALTAAQTGLDVALGQLRAATDAAGRGVPGSLPCGPLSGSPTYQVTIAYLAGDPSGKPDEWVDANAMTCSGGMANTPAYAVLRATGTAGSVTRRLRATYRFKLLNERPPGGLIRVIGQEHLCLEAGTDGTTLQLQPCSPGSPRQRFAYGRNRNLYLASTRSDGGLGRCLDAGASPVRFADCARITQPRQQWISGAAGHFQGASDGRCLYAAGGLVVLQPCDGGTGFAPEVAVGVGAAGGASNPSTDAGLEDLREQ